MGAEMPSPVEISSERPIFPDFAEAWRRRGVAAMLAKRNIKLRYAQTILGVVWVVVQPLLLTGTLTLVLGMMFSLPTDGSPYLLFVFSGTVLWSAFQRIVIETSTSMVSSGALILRVYFPRVLVPISAALTVVVDLLPAYLILTVTIAAYGMLPGWPLLISPIVLLFILLLALSIGLWLTVIDAIYRDIRIIIPSILQLAFFVTPVMYAESAVPHRWAWLYNLNPLVGFLRAFRWSMISGAAPPSLAELALSAIWSFALLGGALMVFARIEQYAIDRI
jgi:lipopolysaccharide transport system permease protein